MWISKAQVNNYYSIEDSGWLDFSPTFNLIVGANNSGKSALLKGLSPNLKDQSHRSPTSSGANPSLINFNVKISPKELFARMSSLPGTLIFPIKAKNGTELSKLEALLNTSADIELECSRTANRPAGPRDGCSIAREKSSAQKYVSISNSERGLKYKEYVQSPENITEFIDKTAGGAIFYFSPERMHLSRSNYGRDERLVADASNLARVLAYLQGEKLPKFEKIEAHLSDIVPGIEGLSVGPQEKGFEILTWPEKAKKEGHLAFSLADSGTGIAQLVAILTAVVTEDQSIIIIDEINTFLHPAAIKKLLFTLKDEYAHHQYIISTHSSEVIAHADPDVMYLVEKDKYTSSFQKVNRENAAEVRQAGAILGFSMMDVFGYDHIIWVEGETEETCFPQILRLFNNDIPKGTIFTRVHTTDPFGKERSASGVAALYDFVQSSTSPLLNGYAFGLDRETHDENFIRSVSSKIKRLRFLPRRCIECYLIDSESIADLMRKWVPDISGEVVDNWLIAHGGDEHFGASTEWDGDIENPAWLLKVDAPKLIKLCITETSDSRLSYDKVKHNPVLVSSIFQRNPYMLVELKDFVLDLVSISES